MEQFIQRILSCTGIKKSDNLIATFPVIRVQEQGKVYNLLIFRFQRSSIPNYLVIGAFKDGVSIDLKTFAPWLKDLNALIFSNPREDRRGFQESLKRVTNSWYFSQLLYTQEGYDLINGKEYFVNAGLLARTVEVDCQVLEDGTIEFQPSMRFNLENQFLKGSFFREYKDYEAQYFLSNREYSTMSYLDVLAYMKLNANRLLELAMHSGFVSDEWVHANIGYLLQILDAYLTNNEKNKSR